MIPMTAMVFDEAVRFPTSHQASAPIKCLWSTDILNRSALNDDTIIALVTFLGSYAWKMGQLFDSSRRKFDFWLRCKPEAALERAARRLISQAFPSWIVRVKYRAVVAAYIQLCLVVEIVESFMSTLILIGFSNALGVTQIYRNRYSVYEEVRQDEMQMSFGQILPLLLLLQPTLAVAEWFSGGRDRGSESQKASDAAAKDVTVSIQNRGYDVSQPPRTSEPAARLTDAFVNPDFRLLSAREKEELRLHDTIKDQLYLSRSFVTLLWLSYIAIMGIALAVVWVEVVGTFAIQDILSMSARVFIPIQQVFTK
ncbi:hypothetical protein TruAng_003404 [Truncatella angustata]|nr:hypothetical protein TruAng_003404 [Truncatella angustata]